MNAALRRFVRWVMRDVTYDRVFAARVEFDHGDGTFDVTSEDEEIRGTGLVSVPVAVGVAGVAVKARQGTRCLIGFENRDPGAPRIVGWEFQADRATLVFDGGIAGVARQGDLVRMLISEGAPVAGTLSGTVIIPGTPPVPTPVPLAPFTGAVTNVEAQRALFGAAIIGGARKLQGK